ncbi:hypothetical protein OnM2_079043 [Erysiphe neolycopersici]|uniref:Uncharacterized protein n=1 Tax=Erysiphe neolycopersici TaxID=212602 RepID=A0A420HGY5_9PEZI|nr:hypothetical protein OnM2_079043 [Erysiphe neolycopersici]
MLKLLEKKSQSVLDIYQVIGGRGGKTGLVFAVIGSCLLFLCIFVIVVRVISFITNDEHLGNIGWGFRPDLCEDLHDLEMGWRTISTTEPTEADKVIQRIRKRREQAARKAFGHLRSFSCSTTSPQLPAPSWSQSSSMTSRGVFITQKNPNSRAQAEDKIRIKGKQKVEMSDGTVSSLRENTYRNILGADRKKHNLKSNELKFQCF